MSARSTWVPVVLGAALLAPLGVLLCAGVTAPLSAQPVPVLVTRPSPVPVPLRLSRIDDRSISARLGGALRPGAVTIELRNLGDQTVTSVDVDGSVAGSSFVLPAPFNGELRIIRPAARGARRESSFVGVVAEPVVAGVPRRILYGPGGRASVLFAEDAAPPDGTQVVITSPAISTPPPPARLVADTVEIGLVPAAGGALTAVVGVTPWSPPGRTRLVLSVFDAAGRRWADLPSRTERDGTVYASGPIPGVYALRATR